MTRPRSGPQRGAMALSALVALSLAVITSAPGLAAGQRPLTTVTIRTVPFLSYGVFYVAQAEKLFEAEGLRAEFVEMETAAPVIPALIRGDIDVLPAAMSPAFFNAMVRGARVRLVAGVSELAPGGCTYTGLVVSRAMATMGAVAQPAILKGRRLGAARSIVTDYLLDTFFRQHGLQIGDLNAIDLPGAAELEALRAGRIDVGALSEPALARGVASGYLTLLSSFHDVAPNFQYSLMVFGPSLLDRQPEVADRFMRAYLRAIRRFNERATDRNVAILSEVTGLDRDLLKRVCWPYIRHDGRLNPASVLDFQTWAVQRNLVDRALPIGDLYDSRFIESANRAVPAPAR
jgi:NitT/TauT family transport system substrate-binding protein